MELYRIENLTFTYPDRDMAALREISLIISRGEFVTLCGPSGSGKTTLLRHLKPSTTPHGVRTGNIYFNLQPQKSQVADYQNQPNRNSPSTPNSSLLTPHSSLLKDLSPRDAASKIGFVMQSPENQIVTDKVWHELAFGLESLGAKTPEIRLRVAEMASFFGIQAWFHKPVTELSGGQKQLLALASIMALQPSALILDEPTSQLDPIAAGEFLSTIGKINRELGVTIILTEHRLEEAFPLSTRAIVIDNGKIIADGLPREVGLQLSGQDRGMSTEHPMFRAMPTPMRVWAACLASQDECKMQNVECRMNEPPTTADFDNTASIIQECPITVREGARWLRQIAINESCTHGGEPSSVPSALEHPSTNSTSYILHSTLAVALNDVWFKYGKDLPDVIKDLAFEARYGEITAILGGNGTGKTTTLSLIAGLYEPYRGTIKIHEPQHISNPPTNNSARREQAPALQHLRTDVRIYTLPQNPQSLFVAKTLREDLLEILSERKLPKEEKQRRFAAMVKLCLLDGLLDYHPYDLSGGEQQRAALAKVLLLQPEILLLDEPTKGLDAEFKQVFAAILKKLTSAGVAVIMASHDIEFCAEHADRCALFFDGNVVTQNTPQAFFSGNSFYTTSANRMARDVLPEAVTADDIILALGGILPPAPEILDIEAGYDAGADEIPPPPKAAKLSILRSIMAGIFIALLIATAVFTGFNFDGFKAFISGGSDAVNIAAEGAWLYIGIMLSFAAGIVGLTLALTYGREITKHKAQSTNSDSDGDSDENPIIPDAGYTERGTGAVGSTRKLSKRTIAAAALILLTIPVTIIVGSYFFGDRRYYFTSLLIILQTMLPFALVFESRKPQARELVVVAVLCAIAVAGRAAFFMLPQFKPVVAIVIISGVAFGGETGFLVGAMTGFVSNFFFSQGPWTPYQMFAFGIIGFLAGVMFRKGLLRRTPASLSVFGALATFIVYGGIMNPSYIMIYQGAPTGAMLLAAYLQGLPMDLVHAAATVTFMLIVSRPMLEKLDRIKTKYGLVE